MNKSEIAELLEKGQNAVYDELRQIYCCKGAEFARPTLEKAWKEIARLERAIAESQARPFSDETIAEHVTTEILLKLPCHHLWKRVTHAFRQVIHSKIMEGLKLPRLGDGEPSPVLGNMNIELHKQVRDGGRLLTDSKESLASGAEEPVTSQSSTSHPDSPKPSPPDTVAELADEIERTVFFREIDCVETEPTALKRQIANLVRSKVFGPSGAAQEVSPPSPEQERDQLLFALGCQLGGVKSALEVIDAKNEFIEKAEGDTRELKAALRWIPVKEKLPPVEQDVLVWVKFEGYNEWQWTDSWLDQDGTWALGSAERYTVSHWRHVLNPTELERLLG